MTIGYVIRQDAPGNASPSEQGANLRHDEKMPNNRNRQENPFIAPWKEPGDPTKDLAVCSVPDHTSDHAGALPPLYRSFPYKIKPSGQAG